MNENNNQDNWVSGADQSNAPETNAAPAPEQSAPKQETTKTQEQIASQAQVYNPNPQPNQTAPAKDDNSKATTLCVISLVCHYAPVLGLGSVASVLQESGNAAISATGDMLQGFVSLIMFGAWVASWVLMIVVRTKYKNSTFGKVLMWLYIIGLILSVLAVIAIIAIFAAAFAACAGESDNMIESFRSLT